MGPNLRFAELASPEAVARAAAALTAHGIEAVVVPDSAAAKAEVLKRIPAGAQVFTMSSQTLQAIGLAKTINESGQYDSVRNKLMTMDHATQGREMRQLGAAPDWAVGSVHAVTEDGHLFIASNTGSQLGAYAYAAGHVIWVVGTQKAVADDDEARRRVFEYSLPLENERAKQAYGIDSTVNKLLTIYGEKTAGRLTVMFVPEKLGF